MFKKKKVCEHLLLLLIELGLLLFSCFVACLVPLSFFKNHASLFFNVHDINCIVLLWALLCAFVCQLLPLPLCERSLCCCAWFMLLAYVKTFFGCLYFGFLYKPTLFQHHLLLLFIFVLRLFLCCDHCCSSCLGPCFNFVVCHCVHCVPFEIQCFSCQLFCSMCC